MEVELATAAVEAELDAQEWNMQEIERIQEEQVNLIGLHVICSRTTLAWHHIRPEYSRACLTDLQALPRCYTHRADLPSLQLLFKFPSADVLE